MVHGTGCFFDSSCHCRPVPVHIGHIQSVEFTAVTIESQSKEEPQGYSFGAFKGVFTPSILTILGVIMYLRFGWVLGQVGLPLTLLIVTMASSITFLTALSLSASATNMKVGGGGAYYIISRSLGVEVGSAIGVPLFLAQALGVAFYITGFSEALAGVVNVQPLIEQLPFEVSEIRLISILTLAILAIIALISADLALKTQMLILAAIFASLVSFFLGHPPAADAPAQSAVDITQRVSFWAVFAVFFPAVTGIEAGLALSGDLKDPAKALPRGTIAAVLAGYLVYMAIPPVLLHFVPDSGRLLAEPMIMQSVARWGALILVGVWAATLSSALGSLLGAPRTMQALSRDGVFPRFLGRGFGAKNDPRIATAVTFLVALTAILLGDLNMLAPVLSMFFLTSYGLLNLSAGLEGLIDSPTWRPQFRVKPALSLAGAAACFSVMFMINAGATFAAIVVVGFIYALQKRRNLTARWGDMRYDLLNMLAEYAIRRLSLKQPDERTWRPNILVLSGSPQSRWYLIELAHALVHNACGMTVATVVSGEKWIADRIRSLQASIAEYLIKRDVHALVKILPEDDILDGATALIKAYGYGPMRPNTILMGDCEEWGNVERFAELVINIYRMNRNLVLVREVGEEPVTPETRYIDIWWRGQQTNIGMMLTLAYMMKRSEVWSGADIRLKRILDADADVNEVTAAIEEHTRVHRLDVTVDFVKRDRDNVFDIIRDSSRDAALVFMGLRAPEPEETAADYAAYYQRFHRATAEMPVAYTLAGESVDFEQIIGLS